VWRISSSNEASRASCDLTLGLSTTFCNVWMMHRVGWRRAQET
jgi:hypothetical protein